MDFSRQIDCRSKLERRDKTLHFDSESSFCDEASERGWCSFPLRVVNPFPCRHKFNLESCTFDNAFDLERKDKTLHY